ncbi:unnamed protein product [Didymodactylos carnosus]|uniref:Major facilitator superfamily (MFS) profile domain-containing protein n=1 Tax=Didymodactylos carnosus TaxID=1234261 RepID=A0A815EXX2_9BILA|nr:unnamed protein product [Didymodactylos carnosus]CAF4150708.1 unnamed protein product [Didymodactylos carnosus]
MGPSLASKADLPSFDEVVYLPALLEMVKDYESTKTLGLLTISIYLFTMSLSSLIWGVLADYYGRKPMVISGFGAFILSSIGCYFSPNIYILLIFRALQGCFISVAVVVGQGTIADIYRPNQRGTPYGIFYAFFFAAGLLAPALGGVVCQQLGWRATFILVTTISFILFISYILIVPETQQYTVICTYQSQQQITLIESDQVSKPTLTNPCAPLSYLIDSTIIPYISVLACSYIAVNCSALLVPTELAESPYSFRPNKIGLLFIPIAAAFLIGSVVGGKLSDLITMKFFQTSKLLEGRMIPGLIFSILISIGLIIYAWAFQYGTYILIPILGQMLAGFGQAASRPGVISYVTVKYQESAASIIAANTFVQQLSTAIVLTFTVQIVQVIHEGAFFTTLALCNVLTTLAAAMIICRKLISSRSPEKKLLL